jgi:hypothetical protein
MHARLRRSAPPRPHLSVLVVFAAACGLGCEPAPPTERLAEEAPAEAAQPEAAPEAEPEVTATTTPRGTVVAEARTPDGRVFEAEYGRRGELPTGFPDDVPLYAGGEPVGSFSAVEYGMVVNLHAQDPPERVYDWYREHFVAQGWTIEQELAKHSQHVVAARKGNRVASVVITGVPELTQILLSLGEDR